MAFSESNSGIDSSHSSPSPPKVPFMKRVFSKKGPHGPHPTATSPSSGHAGHQKPGVSGAGTRSQSPPDGRPSSQRTPSSGTASSFVDVDGSSIFDDAEFESSTIMNDTTDESSVSSHDSKAAASIPKHHGFHDRVEIPQADESGADDPTAFFRTQAWEGLTYESFLFPSYMRLSTRKRHVSPKFNKLFLAQELNAVPEKNTDSDAESSQNLAQKLADGAESKASDADAVSAKDDENIQAVASQREILVMEWSRDGRYLASAGRDHVIKIWKVVSSPLAKLENERKVSESVTNRTKSKEKMFANAPVFHQNPVMEFRGHSNTILSLDWSKNNFLISGGMDRTARLWHVERSECLQTFKHSDFVTTVNFHPNDDRFFLSGSLDNRVRLWSILENSVAYSNDLGNDILITATCFTPDGERCMVGSFSGTLSVLETKGLHLVTKFHVKKRSISNAFQNSNDNKVTGIKVFENKNYSPSVQNESPFARWNVLITTNDSKIRLVDSHSKKLVTRFKGLTNTSSSIVASMTEDQNYIIAGSEDHWCYIWENNNSTINNKLRSAMRDILHDGVSQVQEWEQKHKKYTHLLHDNRLVRKLNMHKDSEEERGNDYVSNENNSYISFHAHHSNVNVAKFAPESSKVLLDMSDDVIYDLVKRGNRCGISNELPKHKHRDYSPESVPSTTPDLGHIIVTTDQSGLIRVFRQDSAYAIRKELTNRYRRALARGSCDPSDKPVCQKLSKEPSLRLKKKLSKNRALSPARDVRSIKEILGRGHRGSAGGEVSPRTSSYSTMRPQRPSSPVSSEPKVPASEHPAFNFDGVDIPLVNDGESVGDLPINSVNELNKPKTVLSSGKPRSKV
ncbi:WD repeat-containing protein [Meyerozyma sp. JA9]|nr:WD repeat-containing protein [Meyerozyma sp. JA9]